MADESNFLIEILLQARDNASATIAKLTAEVEALRKAAQGDGRQGPTAAVSKDLDETGRAARDSERDLKKTRSEHEALRGSAGRPEIRQGARDIGEMGTASRSAAGDIKAHTVAVDDHRSATSRLGAGLRDTTTSVKENAREVQSAAEKAEDAAKSYEMFDTAVRKGGVGADDARRGYAQFSTEISGLVRQLKSGSDEALHFSKIADDAKSRSGDLGPSSSEIQRVTNAYREFNDEVGKGNKSTAETRRGYKDLSTELGSVGRAFRAGSAEAEHFLGMAERAGSQAKKAGYLAPGDWNWDSAIEKTAARFNDWGVNIVGLSAKLRGLALAGVIGLAQQLDTAVVGLAGGLFSVASAAAQAGVALGGALVSGISQAIPVLAVIGATVERLKSVFQAVGLSNQAETANAASPHKAEAAQLQNADAITNAQHGLQNAYEGVATAQEHVRSSQESLTLARIAAVRNLTDLTLAEKSADLAAQGASISLSDAQRALQQAIQQGNTSAIQGAQLSVREAELGVTKANDDVPRARQDANRARRQGVEGNPSVVSARQGLTAANKAVTDQKFQIRQAQDQLKLAQVQQSEPNAGQSSQQTQLNALTKNFTGPEKALYASLKRISAMLKSPDSPLAKLSDYIVEPVAKGVSRITQLLGSRTAMEPLDKLAKSMGGALTEVEKTLTSNKSVSFFDEMATDASKNIPLIAHAFDSLLGFFQDVAKTAAPFLHDIIKGFDNFATNLNTKFSSTAGLDKLRTFFDRAEGYAKDIAHMAGAFAQLVEALGRDSAPTGDNLITSLTKSMNAATDWVNTHGPEVRKFFEGTGEVVKQLALLLFGVGKAMIQIFNPASTAAFQQVLTQIILPALTKIFNVLGWITTALLNIAKAFPGGTIALQAIAGIALTLFGIGKLYEPIAKVVTIMKALVVATEAFRTAEGIGKVKAAWEAFHGVMSKVKDETKAAAGAQIELNAAEDAGVGAATADAGAQTEVAAAEDAGAAGGAAGVGSKLGKAGLIGGATVAGLYGVFGNKDSADGKNRGIPTGSESFLGQLDRYGAKETNDLTHLKIGDFVSGIFGSNNDESKSEQSLRKFGDQISKIKGSLSNLPKGEMEKIHAEATKLGEDPSLKKFKGSLESIKNATDPSLAATKRWSEKMRDYLKSLGPAAKSVAETFENINQTTGSILDQIREVVHTNSKKIAEDLGTNTKEGKDALVANFGQAVDAINSSMAQGTVSTGKGMQEIGRLVGTALKEYGINPAQINKYVAATAKLTKSQEQARNLHAAGYEAGGWAPAVPGGNVYRAGEGGHEEVVLTTDPKHGNRQSQLLGEYLQKAPHVMGYEKGGFVGDSGKDFHTGQEPKIAAALQRLGEMIHKTIYGISGARTEAESAALGYPKDPHTEAKAIDIGVGSQLRSSASVLTAAELAKVGLYRPFYPSMGEKEINHVQLLNESGNASNAVSKGIGTAMGIMASGYEIAVPKVKGLKGQLEKVSQGALNKIAKAAGEYVQKTVGALPSPELGPEGKPVAGSPGGGGKGRGGAPAQNEKLGKEMMIAAGYPASEWPYLQKLWTKESGWSDTAQNNPSAAWLAAGNASGIPQSDGHGNVYEKGNARQQIAWGLKYLKERWKGSIKNAYNYDVANLTYAAGGMVKRIAMAAGGKLASWGGAPVWAELHEGERVMNPMQYGEAAHLAGMTPTGLDQHMGYDGKPKQSFDDGGLVSKYHGIGSTGIKGRSAPVESAAASLSALSNSALSGDNSIVKVFKAVHDGFAALGKIEKKSGQLTSAMIPFVESITNESTGVIARLQTAFTALTGRLNVATSKTNFKVAKTSVQSGRLVSSASPLEQTDRSLKDLQTERKNLQEQSKIVSEAEKQIQGRIKSLSKKKQTSGVKKELQSLVGAYNSLVTSQLSIEEQTAQNLEQAAQASQARVQDIVTNINNTIGLQAAEIQARQGSAQTLGKFGELAGIDAEVGKNAGEHIKALEGALNEAHAIGDTELEVTIKQEIVQLQQTVTQAAAQAIQDAEQAIQQGAGLETARAGLDQIRAQVAGARGNLFGAGGQLGQSNLGYQTEISNARSQIGALSSLRGQAEGIGDTGQVISLTEAIISLEGTIEQNEQALMDNTAVVSQAYISQVTRTGSFTTGAYGGLIQLLQTAGQITGATNVAGEAGLYQQSNKTLQSTNQQLVGGPGGLNAFLASLGITGSPNLEGLSGQSLVTAISNMDLNGIESHMDPAQQQTFETIISALIQNSEQIETNNKELATLNGQLLQPQSFSSPEWSLFRSAIFTGMGGLVPSVAQAIGVTPGTTPALTGAGSLGSLPLGSPQMTSTGAPMIAEQNIHVTEPTEVVDPVHMGQTVAYLMKHEK